MSKYIRCSFDLIQDGNTIDAIVHLKGATEADLAAVNDWLRRVIDLSRAQQGAPPPRVVMIDPDQTYTPGQPTVVATGGKSD